MNLYFRCNGVTDCLYGEDEKNCSSRCVHENEFLCASSKKCIPQEWVCDGHNDCGDNSDEKTHTCLLKNVTGSYLFFRNCRQFFS